MKPRMALVERTLMARTRRMGAVLMALLALVFAFALTPTKALAATGWVKQANGTWRYYESDDYYYQDGIYEIANKFYGFKADGTMLTGWYEEKYDNGYSDWYYFGKNGAALTGWQKISGKWYFFNDGKSLGDYGNWPWMLSHGVWKIGKTLYFFNKSGAMGAGGWQKYTDSWVDPEGKTETYTDWYYANSSGALATGWKKVGGTWYYFNKNWGGMYSGGLYCIDGSFYFFKNSGAMATGWQKDTQTIYDENGKETKQTVWYYLKSNGKAATGWLNTGGKWYYFDSEVHKETWDGDTYYYGYVHMRNNELSDVNGKTYYFNKGGDMAVGWKQIGGAWFYFNKGGDMAKGKWVGNYWLKDDGTMAVNEWVDGGKYYVGANGAWVKGKTK